MNGNGEDQYDSDESSVWDDLCDVDVVFGLSGGRDTIVCDWNFIRRSEYNKYLDQSLLERNLVGLEYNSMDKWLLEQAVTEINHILHMSRMKLFESDNNQSINPSPFAGAIYALICFPIGLFLKRREDAKNDAERKDSEFRPYDNKNKSGLP